MAARMAAFGPVSTSVRFTVLKTFTGVTPDVPAVILAPMEGVTDSPMRAVLTEFGDYDFCVSEFLRISQDILPERVYFDHVPELAKGCRTPAGTPIQWQLLGGDPDLMARRALRAIEVGAPGIDLNFGCPAPTVNRHDGGAALLRYPHRIREIVKAVRDAVPARYPVSAKLRLGFDSMEQIFLNAKMVEEGGASWITIHARTKTQGYVPPAYWKYIGEVKKTLSIPVVANGEIWNREDFLRCREQTGCIHFMIGRGALADPSLPIIMARELGISDRVAVPFSTSPEAWRAILHRFAHYSEPMAGGSRYTTRRIKQWMKIAHLKRGIPWFDQLKVTEDLPQVFSLID